jgi:hypothetical protein
MVQQESPEKKKGFLDRLPKLGRVSQLILVIGGFLVIFVPLLLIYQQQPQKQIELKNTLANLQKVLAVAETPKAKYEAELAQATAENDAAMAVFPAPDQSPAVLEILSQLASENDIYVTGTAVSSSTPSGSIGPVLSFSLNLKGQVPKFENFLLALDTKLPTARITSVTFAIASEGKEYDTAAVKIDVLTYAGSQ